MSNSYSKTELARACGVSHKTFSKWLKLFQDKIPDYQPSQRIFTPRQSQVIIDHLDITFD